MKFILMPFIGIYHVVSAVMSAPSKLFQMMEDKAFESKDKKQKLKEQKELAALNASNANLAETNVTIAAPTGPTAEEVAVTAQPTDTDGVQLSDMASEDEAMQKKARPMKSLRYTVLNSFGKKEVGTFDAEEEQDVRAFLLSQEYEILEVKERSKYDIDINFGNKISAEDLSFSLTQLSTYIKSGIPLVDGVKILAKQTKKPVLKKSFNQLVYELLRGESFSNAMMAQGETYPKLLINMVKTAEMTGDLPSILDDMSEYYTSMERTKKQMKSAMTYPIVVLTIAFGVLIFMLVYLVPQFSGMYADNDATMPALTLAILSISDFIQSNWIILILCAVAVVVVFLYLFKNVLSFKTAVQTFLMHVPVIKDIIIYNEIANFTKTFASLINHGVFITDSMEILSKITDNEIYKRIINKTLVNLGKGDTISMAFKGEWAIPIVAYEMLVTGETTGQLGTMMEKVADHFQNLHKGVIDQMKSLVEPILICFLAVVVGIILISIIQPMFGIYSSVS
jgi:type IV pilus assembly protein PilC